MDISEALRVLERDLRGIFGGRLQSFVVYGERVRGQQTHAHHGPHAGHQAAPVRTMVVVDAIGGSDLRACATSAASWHDAGLATPLLLASHEFERSLDAFPLEFGTILADHLLVSGRDPFETLTVDPADVRRACEVQARSHLLHLREGYVETRGRADALAVLIVESAPALAALVTSLVRLEADAAHDAATAARHAERTLGVTPGALTDIVTLAGIDEISSPHAERLFPPYLDAVEKLVAYVDSWSGR